MRRAIAAFLFLALPGLPASTGCAGHTPPDASSPTTTVPAAKRTGAGGAPTWLPAYTAQQQALLTPVDHPIQTPAARVFPDLERFWYANNRRLDGPDEAFKFTRMVATVLNDSPRFYALDVTPGDVANIAVQYGPPAVEPDGWSFARRGPTGVGELNAAPGAAEARVDFDRGAAFAARGEAEPAIAAFRAAASKSPKAPAIHMALAAALAKSGKLEEAERAYNEAIGADPTFAPAYTGLAELSERRGDVAVAKKVLTEALAYQPSSRRALTMAQRLGGGGQRVAPFAIFLDVDSVGAIRVTTAVGTPAQMYGGCRAVMRYEPEVRAHLFEQPAETPYYLSVVEEVICLEAALGAYMIDQQGKGENAPDERLEKLLDLAHEEGLSGYVMFEILGKHRPERARVAPPEVHRTMVRYVERELFGQKPAATGVYTVQRENADDVAERAPRRDPRDVAWSPRRAHTRPRD